MYVRMHTTISDQSLVPQPLLMLSRPHILLSRPHTDSSASSHLAMPPQPLLADTHTQATTPEGGP
jgi:hypothetical protein